MAASRGIAAYELAEKLLKHIGAESAPVVVARAAPAVRKSASDALDRFVPGREYRLDSPEVQALLARGRAGGAR
jgi:hypothetical protein